MGERQYRYEIVGRFISEETLADVDTWIEARAALRHEIRKGGCSEYWISDRYREGRRYDLNGAI